MKNEKSMREEVKELVQRLKQVDTCLSFGDFADASSFLLTIEKDVSLLQTEVDERANA